MMLDIEPASETSYFNQNEKMKNAQIMCQLALSLLEIGLKMSIPHFGQNYLCETTTEICSQGSRSPD
jgi:hypothetical protein